VTRRNLAPRGFVALYPEVSKRDVRCEYQSHHYSCEERALFFCIALSKRFCKEHLPQAGHASARCCRGLRSTDLRCTGQLRLHGDNHPTIFASAKTADNYGRARGGGEIREFDVDYLPVAHVDLQQRAEAYERLAMEWMERARQVIELMKTGQSHAPAPTETPRRRTPRPRRVRCAECGILHSPDTHDPELCRFRRENRALPPPIRGNA
jgi:hypothetical protein